MAKHKTRTIIAWVGAFMLTLGVACLSLRVTEWSATHHAELTASTIIFFMAAAVFGTFWLLTKDESTALAPATPVQAPVLKMKAEGDITKSPQFGVVHGDVHYSQTDGPRIETPKAITPSTPVPDFHWSFRYARLIFADGIWRENETAIGFQAIVADIAMPAATGAHFLAPTVYGAIQIKGSTTKFAKRPYWIDECANEMHYELGHVATMVVLCFESNIERKTLDWVVYQNPLNSIPDHPFWNRSKDLGKRVALAVDRSPDIVISLVDAYSKHVLDKREIRLTISDSIWNIKELPNEA